MSLKTLTPADVVTHAAGILQTKPLTAWISGNGFAVHGSTTKRQIIIVCHRCRRLQPRRGAMSASIEIASGQRVTHHLCAACCAALRDGSNG